ncbi:MAG: tetratricopeptide repeat protein [Gammaproteobacteria bacterium]|nr:tetratricopeptide repeat protein [Gammaproteobacteria bacterium]
MSAISRFSIGRLDVDATARRLCAGDAEVRVEPKVFDLLLYMVRHRGRAIAQDELLEQVWGRRIASDAVISQAIHKLRALLRTHAGLEDALVTLRGVGYRMDADISPQDDSPALQNRLARLPWPALLGALFLVIGLLVWWQAWRVSEPLAPRIALLPMENATGNDSLDWVRAGGTALISEHLERSGIEVVAQRELNALTRAAGEDGGAVEAAVDIGGVDQVFAPRLVPDEGGYRLELIDLTDRSRSRLELAGSGPASLSLGMAGLLAERLGAPRHTPAGALGLGNPFLDEAYARAYHHRQTGDLEDALELYEYILREAPEAHWARYHYSITLRYAGEMEAARAQLQELFETRLEDAWLDAAIRSTMGNLEWYAGDLERAEQLYLDARERFESHGMTGGVASALGNLGMVAFTRADYERGRHFAHQALDIYRRQNNRIQQARLLHNIGYSHFDQGNLEQALSFLERAHARRVELGLRDQAANTRTVIAEIALEQGRLDEGERMLEQALAEFRSSGNVRAIGQTIARLAGVDYQRGRFASARELALESLTLARSRNEQASAAQSALLLGRSLHSLGDHAGAGRHYEQAASIWSDLDNTPGRITCQIELVRLALDRGEQAAAQSAFSKLEDLAGDYGDQRYLDSVKALGLRLQIVAGQLGSVDSAIDELLLDLDPGELADAELIIELAEALHRADARHPSLERLMPAAEQWATRLYPAARHLYRTAADPDECRAASRALEQLHGPEWRRSLTLEATCESG